MGLAAGLTPGAPPWWSPGNTSDYPI